MGGKEEEEETNLRVLEGVESRRVNTSARREVDEDVGVGVLLGGLSDGSVDGEEGLLCTPVELLDVVTSEGVDHGSDRGSLPSAREVEVEHSLDSSRLETVNEGSSGLVEGSVGRSSGGGGGVESNDVVSGLGPGSVGGDVSNRSGRSDGDGSGGSIGSGNGGEGDDDGSGSLRESESERNDLSDMSLGSVDGDGDTERLSKKSESLETLLVVGSWKKRERGEERR